MNLALYRMSNQFWDLVRTYFEAARIFQEIHATYESKVMGHADAAGVDRRLLRLSGEEVAALIDFTRLERLCNCELMALKTIAHSIFRSPVSTDPFDRYASQIFHETSILKEERYKVGTIAPEYQQNEDLLTYQTIIDEAHEAFPRQVHMINTLMRRAQQRLEELMPYYRRDRVTLRSVYLFGDDIFDGFYPNGYEDGLARLFPEDGGTRKGLLEVARSFLAAGFADDAIEALERAQRLPQPIGSPEEVALQSAVQIEIDELCGQLKADRAKLKKRKRKASA